jgi:competence protein ComEA
LALVVLLVASLVVIVGWWLAEGGLSGRLAEVAQSPAQLAAFQVDLNSAEWPELAQLPGVGPVLAKRIAASRAAHGPFADADSLGRVRGVGPETLKRIRPYLIARPLPPSTK